MTESPESLAAPTAAPDDAPAPPPPDAPAPPTRAARRSWGYLLVGIGALMLLDRLLPNVTDLVWTAVMLVAGAMFVRMWRREPDVWWPLIPGLALLALGAGSLLGILGLDRLAGALSGALLFVGLGTAFLIVYLRDREHWWAVIPSGALLGLAGSAFLGSLGMDAMAGASLFVGLAAAFVWLLVIERQAWAIFPAGAMVALVLVVLGEAAGLRLPRGLGSVNDLVWPLFLIVLGAWLLLRRERTAP